MYEKLTSQEFLKENLQLKKINDSTIINFLMKNFKQIPITYGYQEIWYEDIEIQGSEETKKLYNQFLTHKKPLQSFALIIENL